MKKCLLCLITAIFVISSSAVFAQNKVIFAIGEWAPYTGKEMQGNGMASELVTAACNAAGLKAEYEFFPWKRAEAKVSEGSQLGTFPYKETKEREGRFLFSKTLFSSSFGIVTAKDNKKTAGFKYTKPEDLKSFSVGIVAGTDALKIPLEMAGVKVEEVTGVDQNLKKLEAGRIDFYIDDKAVIYQELKAGYGAEKMARFVFLDTNFGEKNDFKVMISTKHPESKAVMDKINEGLAKITDSGEAKKILIKYGL